MKKPGKETKGRKKTGVKVTTGASRQREGAVALTGLETEIMRVVWDRETVSAAEIREALLPDRPLAHTTILTVLENLRKKKVVRVVPTVGREKKFRAAVAKSAVAGKLLRDLRGTFFDGSAASLVAHLLKSDDVDKEEMEEIRELIERSKSEGKGGIEA